MSADVSFLDAAQAAKRMADKNGVTIDVVFAKFRHGVRKSALSYTDFFWGKGDISLGKKKLVSPWPEAAAADVVHVGALSPDVVRMSTRCHVKRGK